MATNRKLSAILQIMHTNYVNAGICATIGTLYRKGVLSSTEYYAAQKYIHSVWKPILYYVFMHARCMSDYNSGYWWPLNNRQARLNFLNKHITRLQKQNN